MTRSFRPFVTAVLLLIAIGRPADAQWVLLHDFTSGTVGNHTVSNIYWFETSMPVRTGLVGLANGEVWRTTDGGTTWTQTASLSSWITSFSFKDNQTGWLTSFARGIYKTTDAGLTWFNPTSTTLSNLTGAYYLQPSGLLLVTSWSKKSWKSSNDGATFAQTSSLDLNHFAFTDALHGVTPTAPNGSFLYTSDGGNTWVPTGMMDEAWQPLAIPGTGDVYIVSERTNRVLHSTNSGLTWTAIANVQSTATGEMHGDKSMLYMQTETGISFSVDGGFRWSTPCGPWSTVDQGFAVVGSAVFAGGPLATLWYSPGGSGQRRFIFTDSLRATTLWCNPVELTAKFRAAAKCAQIEIVSLDFGSLAFHLKNTPVFPIVLDSTDTTYQILYAPSGPGKDVTRLHIGYRVDGQLFDTSLVLLGDSYADSLLQLLPTTIAITGISACNFVDTSVAILNSICDDLTVLSATLDDASVFSIDPAQIPLVVRKSTTGHLKIAANSSKQGIFKAVLSLRLKRSNIQFDTTIQLSIEISGTAEAKLAFATPHPFGTVSTCAIQDQTIYFTNPLCSDETLTAVAVTPTVSDFSIISGPTTPKVEPSGAKDSVLVRFSPKTNGVSTAQLKLSYQFSGVDRDTLISISGTGLSVATGVLDKQLLPFDTLEICETRVRTASFQNIGCEEIEVVSASVRGALGYKILSPQKGDKIAPGANKNVNVELAPNVIGDRSDMIDIRFKTSSSDEGLLSLPLTGFVPDPIRPIVFLPFDRDNLDPCSDFDSVLTIFNPSICADLQVNSAKANKGTYVTARDTTYPLKLLQQNKINIPIQITTAGHGDYDDEVHIQGPGIDTIITIHFSVRASAPTAATLSIPDNVFRTKLCDPLTQVVQILNRGCDPVTIEDVSIESGSPRFTVLDPPAKGTIALPRTPLFVHVMYAPEVIGLDADNIKVVSGTLVSRIPVSGATDSSVDHLSVALYVDDIASHVEADANLPTAIVAESPVDKSLGLKHLDMELKYNSDVLSNPIASVPAGWNVTTKEQPQSLLVGVDIPANTTILTGDTVVWIRYHTSISDTQGTEIQLGTPRLNAGDDRFEKCVLRSASTINKASVTLHSLCGDALLRRSMRDAAFTIDGIQPNPARDLAEILVTSKFASQYYTITLTDQVGRCVARFDWQGGSKGLQSIPIELSNLSQGAYIITVSDGMARRSRNMMVYR